MYSYYKDGSTSASFGHPLLKGCGISILDICSEMGWSKVYELVNTFPTSFMLNNVDKFTLLNSRDASKTFPAQLRTKIQIAAKRRFSLGIFLKSI